LCRFGPFLNDGRIKHQNYPNPTTRFRSLLFGYKCRYVFLEKLAEIKASNEQDEANSSPIKRQYFVGGYGGGFGSYGYGGGYGGHGYGGGYGGHGHGVHRRAADYPAPDPADKIQLKRQIYAAEEQQARELASRIRELEEEEVHFTCSFLEHNIRL